MSKIDYKKAFLPLAVLGVLLVFYVAWRFFALPSEQELLQIASNYFDKYGLILLFLSSIVEGAVLIGWYYPGSLVIFLGVILAGPDVSKVIAAVGTISLGLYIAYIANFFLGKHGWYKLLLKFGLKDALDDAKERVHHHGLVAIFMSYWQPNLAALVATSAGILDFSFKKFAIYSAIAVVLWNTFWGVLVYIIGERALDLVGLRFIFLVIFAWIVYRIWKQKKEESINIPTP